MKVPDGPPSPLMSLTESEEGKITADINSNNSSGLLSSQQPAFSNSFFRKEMQSLNGKYLERTKAVKGEVRFL